ncbi:PREDICTED: WAP four-disulfide core domain protein 3-like [Nanorana parkeri]|uniref:WAP four-disulfide core domain protein 3-like n=1 Tax=Nanorana parkeri TaxID=125878 RepID=UPI0008543A87|nr:PREDICTED: WAP four-disulfide core domain protein 3-like [Nanorana parkeri]
MLFGCFTGTAGRMKTVLCLLVPLLVEVLSIDGEVPTDKPGKCPPPEELSLGVCFNKLCNTDGECTGSQKCCKTGCDGYQCQMPVDKPGSCPPVEPLNGTTCVKPTTQCISDSNCNDNQKCCTAACNSTSCQIPPCLCLSRMSPFRYLFAVIGGCPVIALQFPSFCCSGDYNVCEKLTIPQMLAAVSGKRASPGQTVQAVCGIISGIGERCSPGVKEKDHHSAIFGPYAISSFHGVPKLGDTRSGDQVTAHRNVIAHALSY